LHKYEIDFDKIVYNKVYENLLRACNTKHNWVYRWIIFLIKYI